MLAVVENQTRISKQSTNKKGHQEFLPFPFILANTTRVLIGIITLALSIIDTESKAVA
jgi:hypothetical protein